MIIMTGTAGERVNTALEYLGYEKDELECPPLNSNPNKGNAWVDDEVYATH
jgi:hypothetical protein